MINKIKQHPYLCLISLCSMLLGLFLIFGSETLIQTIIFQIIGLGLIIISVLKLVKIKQETNVISKQDIIQNGIMIVLGLLVMLNIKILLIISAILILVEPIANILKSNNKKQQAIFESTKLIIGIVLICLCFDFIYKIIFTILGVLLLGVAGVLIYLVLSGMSVMFTFNPLAKKDDKDDKDDIIDI